jgi:ELWxxDGT repeat protein
MRNKINRFSKLVGNSQVSHFFMNIRLRFFLALFFLMLVVQSLFSQVSLVRDINTKADSSFAGYPEFITALNGKVVYTADDHSAGRELWISDGTKDGTSILKDINPTGDGNPVNPDRFNDDIPLSEANHFIVVDNKIVFVADDGEHGYEIWATDGTPAGTILLKDIFSGSASSQPSELTRVEDLVFFSADNGISGRELWRTDGTVAGTFIIKDINAGAIGSDPVELASLGDKLVFTANDGISGNEPWMSDATATGTQLLKDVFDGDIGSSPADYVGVADDFYFRVGSVIWRSNGTTGGTASFYGDPEAEASFIPQAYINGDLYFIKNDFSLGVEAVYTTDGTLGGTQPVYSFPFMPGVTYYYNWLRVVNGELLFAFSYEDRTQIDVDPQLPLLVGVTIQKLNTANGFFDDFLLNEGSIYDPGPEYAFPEALDFIHHSNSHYTINSLGGGISILKKEEGGGPFDFEAVATFSVVSTDALEIANNILFFRGGYSTDFELWRSDGSFATTKLVYNQFSKASSNPQNLIEYNNKLYFQASDGLLGTSLNLWVTDGSEAGTIKIRPDVILADNTMAVYNNALYFIALNGDTRELWKTDGTEANTVLVKSFDIQEIVGGSSVLFLYAYEEISGYELWKTDGTDAGTEIVKDIRAGEDSSYPDGFLFFNNQLIFRADDGANGSEYWISDGSLAGTIILKDINPGTEGSDPGLINTLVYDGTLYFDANDGTHGAELWKTDGTLAGTQLFIDQITGPGSSSPSVMAGLGSKILFSALTTGEPVAKLWSTTGTTSQLVYNEVITDLHAANSTTAYFSFENDLWKTDGTAANTSRVYDFPSLPYINNIVAVSEEAIYLSQDDGVHGIELWKSRGTEATTYLTADLFVGSKSSFPSHLMPFDGAMYFSAQDGLNGRELRKLPLIRLLKITRNGDEISANEEIEFDETEIGETSADVVLTLKNEGDVPITFPADAMKIEGDGAAHFKSSTFATTQLAAGATVQLTVHFEPLAEGEHEASMVILSNDPVNPNFVIMLSGIGKVVTSIDDPANPLINLYPNPARGTFRIETIKPITRVTLLNSSGGTASIKTEISSPTTMTINTDAHTGLYILQIETNGVIVHKKVVILR